MSRWYVETVLDHAAGAQPFGQIITGADALREALNVFIERGDDSFRVTRALETNDGIAAAAAGGERSRTTPGDA
ncbi:MAG: hypothetical protein PHQ28_00800 [Mycobacterium sp.]|nr:hypothetical protein [Mycobacterium sp.]